MTPRCLVVDAVATQMKSGGSLGKSPPLIPRPSTRWMLNVFAVCVCVCVRWARVCVCARARAACVCVYAMSALWHCNAVGNHVACRDRSRAGTERSQGRTMRTIADLMGGGRLARHLG